MKTRDEIITMLHEGTPTITFTKANGDKRVMQCTLQESILPVITESVDKKPARKENLDIISAFDIDVKAWRSFRMDSIISVE